MKVKSKLILWMCLCVMIFILLGCGENEVVAEDYLYKILIPENLTGSEKGFPFKNGISANMISIDADDIEDAELFSDGELVYNDYFFPSGQTRVEYDGIIYPLSCEEIRQDIDLNIMEVAKGNTGILYKLELDQPPVEDSLEMISMGRRYLGYYYVTKENIYLRFVEGMDGYTEETDKKIVEELQADEEAFIENCFVICSKENTDRVPDELGYYSYVEIEGDCCTFKRYNSYMGGTKDYYIIKWEKGKGIVYYLHGAGSRLMEIELFQKEEVVERMDQKRYRISYERDSLIYKFISNNESGYLSDVYVALRTLEE